MDNDLDSANQAAICLAANGYRKLAIDLMIKHNTNAAFEYFDSIEAPERCLELLGIAKESKPPFVDWVKKTTEEALEDDGQEAMQNRLLMLAGFLDRHGEKEHAIAVMKPLMSELEESGADSWFDLLSKLRTYDMGWLAVEFAQARGNEDSQMDLSVKKILGSSNHVTEIWNALKKRHPEDIDQALHELALLAGIIADSNN